MKLTKEDEYK